MELGLRDKIALVTGSSRGIGRAIANSLAFEGVHIAMVARSADALEETRAEVASTYGVEALAIPADLTDPGSADRIAGAIKDRFGRLDILVNNANIFVPTPFDKLTDDLWKAAIDTKLMAVIRLVHASLPLMEGTGWGRIINITGVANVEPGAEFLPVGAVNSAVSNYSKGISKILISKCITVNCVNPGPIETSIWSPMFSQPDARKRFESSLPMKRMGKPEEVAAVVTFLASVQSSYVNGTEIRVDGGVTACVGP